MRDLRRFAVILLVLCAVLLGSTGGLARARTGAADPSGGTATFALGAGSPPTYIFPLVSGANSQSSDVSTLQPLLWRPLYWFGHPDNTAPTVDYALSLANPPAWSDGGRTATITLKSYRWSDGQPVTSRDIEFWMNLLIADKADWSLYAPGDWLDNIAKLSYPNPRTFVITFSHTFNRAWLFVNGISGITPLPQHAWDKTSVSGPIGNYDETTAGAHHVYDFLNRESKSLTSWDTNPLWQVVDGPWRLQPNTGFVAATGYTVLIPNRQYAGSPPHLAKLVELPFTSDTAEFDALLSGRVDYGYLPSADLSLTGRLKAMGYSVRPWWSWGLTFIMLNYPNRQVGPVLKQLYVREAMQRLINQPEIISMIYRGDASPAYGPVPLEPANPYVGLALKT